MYESFGLIGIQLSEKYKDVPSTHARLVFVYIVLDLLNTVGIHDEYSLLKNERMFAVKCGPAADVFKSGLKV
jgi:hypothetical protein